MQTLVIIDMQEEFEAACDPDVQENVLREIRKAQKYGWPIILLEFIAEHINLFNLLSFIFILGAGQFLATNLHQLSYLLQYFHLRF